MGQVTGKPGASPLQRSAFFSDIGTIDPQFSTPVGFFWRQVGDARYFARIPGAHIGVPLERLSGPVAYHFKFLQPFKLEAPELTINLHGFGKYPLV